MMKTLYIPEIEEQCFARLTRLIAKMGIVTPLIYDVGANIGQSIEKFRHIWPEAPIHSFEANPAVFEQLTATWGRVSGVMLQPIALSDQIGTVPFYSTRVPEVSSLLAPTARMQTLSTERKYDYEQLVIPSDTLDHYCSQHHVSKIDILKIDVQGAELAVLKGAYSLLQQGHIDVIYLETTFADCYDEQTNFTELLTYLSTAGGGYQLWDIAPFLYTGRDRLWAANSIFVSKAAAAVLEQ